MVETKVRVVNKYGKDVIQNGLEQGEIIVKGNGVMETGSRLTTDGWLYTGDVGTIGEDGRINIIDRKKDIVLSDGKNISSIDIENILLQHPAIQEAAIIAIPHIERGEILHGFVVLHEDYEVTEQEIMAYTKETLADSKCPTAITFMDELPRTSSGKILRVQLSEHM